MSFKKKKNILIFFLTIFQVINLPSLISSHQKNFKNLINNNNNNINKENNHNCGFNYFPHKSASQLKKESYENLSEKEKERFLQDLNDNSNSKIQSIFLPIRIHYDYTTLEGQNSLYSSTLIEGIKQVLAETKDMLEKLINIKRYTNPLRIKSCDSSVTVSSQVQEGIDTDLVIFPFMDPNLTNTAVEAYATACVISTYDNRPISGLIGFSPTFSTQKDNWLPYFRNLALHELTHVLVFNPNLFEFFRDENGNPYRNEDVFKSKIINGMPRNLLAYPKMLKAAKEHFNCTTIEGVELENQGGTGTFFSLFFLILFL